MVSNGSNTQQNNAQPHSKTFWEVLDTVKCLQIVLRNSGKTFHFKQTEASEKLADLLERLSSLQRPPAKRFLSPAMLSAATTYHTCPSHAAPRTWCRCVDAALYGLLRFISCPADWNVRGTKMSGHRSQFQRVLAWQNLHRWTKICR